MKGEICPNCNENLSQRAEGECCKSCLANEDEMFEIPSGVISADHTVLGMDVW